MTRSLVFLAPPPPAMVSYPPRYIYIYMHIMCIYIYKYLYINTPTPLEHGIGDGVTPGVPLMVSF